MQLLGRIALTTAEELLKNRIKIKDLNNRPTITKMLGTSRSKMWPSTPAKCNSTLSSNFWIMVLSIKTKKTTITRFVTVCNLPRGTPLSSRDNHPPGSSTNNCSSNSSLTPAVRLRLLDSHCLKHILLFIKQPRCNRFQEVEPLWVLMSTFPEKQSSWLRILQPRYILWM